MQTVEKVKTLYKRGNGKRNITLLLRTTGNWMWSGETEDLSHTWVFYFNAAVESMKCSYNQYNNRAFAVRYCK